MAIALEQKNIEKIKGLFEGITPEQHEQIKRLKDEFGINIIVNCPTKDLTSILYDYVYNQIMANKAKKHQYDILFRSDFSNGLAARSNFIRTELLTNYLDVDNIINELHPIIISKMKSYDYIISQNQMESYIFLKNFRLLYQLFTENKEEFDSYFADLQWNKEQLFYKYSQKIRKNLDEINEIFEQFGEKMSNINNYNCDERVINNRLVNVLNNTNNEKNKALKDLLEKRNRIKQLRKYNINELLNEKKNGK